MKKIITIGTLLTLLLTGCTKPDAAVGKIKNDFEIQMAKINDTTYEVTANVQPNYATNKDLTWSVVWAPDAASETDDDAFKAGKTVTDYVGLTVSENTHTATITLKEGFGSLVHVTAAITEKPSVKATVKVEYKKKLVHNFNSNYKLKPAVSTSFVNPLTYSDTVGTLDHNHVITYEYANKLYWYGGSQTTPVEWTDNVTATRGDQSTNLVLAIANRMGTTNTQNFDFLAKTYIFTAQYISQSALDDLAYAVLLGDTTQAKMYRNKGATIALGFKVLVDGVVKSSGTADSEYQMVPIDFTGYEVTATSISLTDTTIIF